MMQSEWKSAWMRGGKISDVCWIDRDVMAWCSGTHIVFFDCAKNLQTLWRCPESIDGISLLSSHPQMHLLTFSECCVNPRILLFTYPNMEMISECSGGSESGYLAIAFASTEFVISLASFPDYSFIVWNWRTGKQLHSISTPIHDLTGQMIRISQSKPPLIAQLGRDSGRLFIWLIIANSISPLNEEVILPKNAVPTHIDWSPDLQEPILAIADDSGHVYICNKHGGELNRIVFSQRCATCLDYEIPAVIWFYDGILLKTTFCQIRLYKKLKEENNWRKQWYIKTPLKPYILSAHQFRKNKLFFFTHEGIIMRMSLAMEETFPKVEKIFDYGSTFKFLDLIYPWCHHLVAANDSDSVKIINTHNGQEVGNVILDVKGKISYLMCHPDYPLIAISTSVGELCLVTTYNFKNPAVLCKYNFDDERLDLIKFSQCGRHLITGRKRYGNFHCISSIDESFSTIRKIETDHRVLDIIFFDSKDVLTIVMVILPFKRAMTGNCLLIYKLLPTESNVKDPVAVLKMPGPYDHFHYGLETMTMIAPQYSSLQIHNFRVKEDQICLKGAMQSPHQVRAIRVYTNRNWIISYGLDGFVAIVKDFDTSEFSVLINAHHRMDYGVARAMVNLSSELIVALGSDGSLVCMRLQFDDEKTESSIDFNKVLSDESKVEENIELDYKKLNPEIVEMLSQSHQAIPPEESGARTWAEWMTRQRELKEEGEFRQVKLAILEDFEKIKKEVTKLLDENEELPEEERLPISAFDLDMIGRDQKLKAAKEEREEMRLEREFLCSEMEKVTNWIKTTFWDPQKVKQQSMFAIFGDTEVINFPSVSQDPHEKEMTRWLQLFNELETNLRDTGAEPKNYALFREKYSPSKEEKKTILESILEDEDEAAEKEKLEEVEATSGITTSKFIKPSSQYCQFYHYGFSQLLEINNFLIADAQSLKNYFNKLFNETFALKERAMSSVCETVFHIQFIDSELRLMFDSSVTEIPIAPEWSYKEKPESIITVTDDEVPISPYISPSQQAILTKHAEEQERLRQLMLADDFRRRALMEMMDGVLEVRWEDIIKKDIPKPEFMELKEPEEYTKDEIIMVQNYEKNVENLIRERERYRGILETTYAKKMKTLHETVDRFNATLKDLFQTRMKVESAVLQLDLLRMRGYLRAFHRMEMFNEEKKLTGRISEQESKIERINSLTKPLHDQLAVLKAQRDVLQNKDKQEKNFKAEFPSLGKTALEILKKQYKRRPRIIFKHGTAGDLYLLAKCIVSRDTPVSLLSDYKHYYSNLDALDIQPENLPDTVQLNDWEHLVKIRRQKIELELKLKANSIEINEIEQCITENNGRIEKCQEVVVNLGAELRKATEDQSDFVNDMEMQLVLQMGQVEIALRGQRNETENSKLIPIHIIQSMNEEILEAGDEKLKAMQSLLEFKRGILAKEWQHKTLRMKIEDLQEELKEVKNILVTKRMHEYLRKQALGSAEGKTTQDLERQIAAMQRIVEKSVNDWISRIEAVEKQIEARNEENVALDKKITKMNVDRWEMELKRDLAIEEQSKEFNERKMKMISQRSKLCRKIQKTFTDVLALRLESELLRMKKYPALPGCVVVSENCNC